MTDAEAVRRETIASVVINTLISAGFFGLVFGFEHAPALTRLSLDLLPQSFMVALMGSLIPGLLTNRRQRGGRMRQVALRSLATACAALAFAAVLAAISYLLPTIHVDTWPAFAGKLAYASALSLLVTPRAVVHAMRIKAAG